MNNTLITQDRLDELIRLCGQTTARRIAEVGVYKGGSLKFLAERFPLSLIVGFDTFEGLPKEQWSELEIHSPGEFNDTSIEAVKSFVNAPNVKLVKGLFPDSANEYSNVRFDFVHVDTDFYQSVKACIEWFWPRLNTDGIMVFDDFKWPNCPGVKKALDESGLKYQPTRAKFQAYVIKDTIE